MADDDYAGPLDNLKPGQTAFFPAMSPARPEEMAGLPDTNTYYDSANALMSGVHGLGASASALLSQGRLTGGGADSQKYWALQAQDQREQAGRDISRMSPEARESIGASITDPKFWHAPLRAIKLQTLQAAPGIAAAAAPAVALGPLGAGAAMVGGALGGAAVTSGGAISDFQDIVDNADPKELAKNPEFAAFTNAGYSFDDAKRAFVNERIANSGLGWKSAIAGAVGGVGGVGVQAAKGAIGVGERGVLRHFLAGSIEAGLPQFAQDLSTSLAIQQTQGGVGVAENTQDMINSAARSAAVFGLLGGIGAGAHEFVRGRSPMEEKGGVDAAGTRQPGSLPPLTPGENIYGNIIRPENFGVYGRGVQGGELPIGEDIYGPRRPGGFGAYGEGTQRPDISAYGIQPRTEPPPDYTPNVTGRGVSAEPIPQPTDDMSDALKRRLAQQRRDLPPSGGEDDTIPSSRNDTKPRSQVDYRVPTGEVDFGVSHTVDYSIPSSPITEEAEEALAGISIGTRQRMNDMIHNLMTTGKYNRNDLKRMNYSDLHKLHQEFLTGPSEEARPPPVETQPPVVQTPPVQPTGGEPQGGPETGATAESIDPRTGTPEGGITPASAFAVGPERGPVEEGGAAPGEGGLTPEQAASVKAAAEAAIQEVEARQAAQGKVVQPEGVQPVVTAPVMGEGLKSIEEKIKEAELPKEKRVTKPIEEQEGRKYTKEEIAQITSKKKAENAIVNEKNHLPQPSDWYAAHPEKGPKVFEHAARSNLMRRVGSMVEAAKGLPHELPTEFNMVPKKNFELATRHSALILNEAQRLLEAHNAGKAEPHDYERFVHRERMLREQPKRYNEIIEERSKEARQMMEKEPGFEYLEHLEPAQREAVEEKMSAVMEAAREQTREMMEPPPQRPGKGATDAQWDKYQKQLLDMPLARRMINSLMEYKRVKPEDWDARSQELSDFHDHYERIQQEVRARVEAGKPATGRPMEGLGKAIEAKKAETEAAPKAKAAKAAAKAREEAPEKVKTPEQIKKELEAAKAELKKAQEAKTKPEPKPSTAPEFKYPQHRVSWYGKMTGHGQFAERVKLVDSEEEARRLVNEPIPAGFIRVRADVLHSPTAQRWEHIASRERGQQPKVSVTSALPKAEPKLEPVKPEEPPAKTPEQIRKELEAAKAELAKTQRLEAAKAELAKRRAEGTEPPKPFTIRGYKVTPERTITGRQLAKETVSLSRWPAVLRPMMSKLLDKVLDIAGDIPVHFFSEADMDRIIPGARGAYSHQDGVIVINKERMVHDTGFHELFHAATFGALENSTSLKLLVRKLRDEVHQYMQTLSPQTQSQIWGTEGVAHAFSKDYGEHEFLTALMTRPTVQELFKKIPISDELARTIGMLPWRKKSMWNGIIDILRQAMGMDPRETSAIEAAMAISEHGMRQEFPAAFGKGIAKDIVADRPETPERMQKAFLKSAGEHVEAIKGIDRAVVAQHTKDVAENVGKGWLRYSSKLLNIDKLGLIHGRAAPFVRQIGMIMDKIHHAYLTRMGSFKDLVNRAYILDRTHAHEAEAYARVWGIAKKYNLDPTGEAPKEGTIRAYHWGRLQNAYAELRSPEMRDRFAREDKAYKQMQAEAGESALRLLVNVYDPPPGSTTDAFMQRARAKDLTDEDREHFESQGAWDRVRDAMRKMHKEEMYANTLRNGNWVVHGRFDMPTGGSAIDAAKQQLPDNEREFNTEEEANHYATKLNPNDLHPTVYRAFYGHDIDGKYGNKGEYVRMTHEDARQVAPSTQTEPDFKWRVRLERGAMELAKSPAEARRLGEAMKQAGVNASTITEPMDRRKEETWAHVGTPEQHLFEQRIKAMKNKGANDIEIDRMMKMARESFLSSQASGLVNKHNIQRRNVFGGDIGSAEGLHAYIRMHAHAMAKAEIAPELNKAIDAMNEHEEAHQTDADAGTRSIINNELKSRLMAQQPFSAKSSWLIRNLMNYSFLNFLLRPSHVFLQQMHPWVYSVPELMARHGWAAVKGQSQAMRDLGGDVSLARLKMLKKGAATSVDLWKALREKDIDKAVQLAHGWDPIKEMIGNLKDADERDALTQGWEQGRLHSAFDTSILEGNGFDRSQAMLSQMTQAMEATNRLSVFLNAYRLEKAAHGDHANAVDYAMKRIESSMGVYTPHNIAPIFRNPLLKPVMQFHQMPINLAVTLYNNMYKAIGHTGDKEATAEARKTLAYQLGTAFAIGGMGGMPMDIPKVAGLASQALGGPAPSDYDNKFHEKMADLLGPTMANIIEGGLPTLAGPFAPVLGHRMGFNSDLVFGEPASGSSADIGSWIGSNLAGASASTISGWHNTWMDLEAGNYEHAAESALPGSFRDLVKAYREATQGTFAGPRQVQPASVASAIMQTLGFQTYPQEMAWEGHYALEKEIKAEKASRSVVLQGGTIGDILRWNQLHPEDRITPAQMRRAREPKPSEQALGVKIPKWMPPQRVQQYRELYGLTGAS